MTRFSRLIESIGQQRDKVIEYQTRMTELPALGPETVSYTHLTLPTKRIV